MALTTEQKAFIAKVGKLAAADMKISGVLASLTISQAILESGWGKSGLTVKANALFGIKAGKTWKGKTYSAKTQECYDGVNYTTITDLFRAYGSWEESVADHSALLTGTERYKAVVGETDYKQACKAIKAAGYATAPDYAEKLINIIECYGLTTFDGMKGEQTMTEKENRETIVAIAQSFLGCRESDGSHKKIIDIYNSHKPLARSYPMKYTDAWCACFVSAVSIKAGTTDIMPTECGCGNMIALYEKLGRWEENDAYIPKPGDVIFYDWQDNGIGDNKGAPDHVGIVVSVTGSTIKVIEGNISNAVGYRNIAMNGKFIRGFGLPDFAKGVAHSAPKPDTPGTSSTFEVGDVVGFTGNVHYTSANAAVGKACKPGKAKVTQVAKGTKHPYHLIAVSGGGSTVYGWVDVACIDGGAAAGNAVLQQGAKVQYSGTLYADSYGGGPGKTVNGTYTVSRYIEGRKCGVLLGASGWVPASACKVVG